MNNVPPTEVWADFPILTMTRSDRLKNLQDSMSSMSLLYCREHMHFCIKKSVVSEEGREWGCFTFNLFDLHF